MHACPFPKRHPSELVRDDTYFMEQAYNQALEAWKADEVPIGAVVVHNGRVLATGHNQVESLKDPTAHAEILAIGSAAQQLGDWRLNECTLYVTKEPCPMCSGAAIMARLGRVVYASFDSKMGFMGGVFAAHEIPSLNHKVEITAGVLEAECTQLLQAFFRMKRETESSTT
jgi:tRNA(adenine34) deaminase